MSERGRLLGVDYGSVRLGLAFFPPLRPHTLGEGAGLIRRTIARGAHVRSELRLELQGGQGVAAVGAVDEVHVPALLQREDEACQQRPVRPVQAVGDPALRPQPLEIALDPAICSAVQSSTMCSVSATLR